MHLLTYFTYFPSFSLPFSPFPSFPLEVGPLTDCGYRVWGALKLPSGSGRSPAAEHICHTSGSRKRV